MNQQLIASLRDLAARKRAEAEQCERTAAMLELELTDAAPVAVPGRGRRRAGAATGAAASANGRAKGGRNANGATRTRTAARASASPRTPRARGNRQPTPRQAAIVELLGSEPKKVWTPREIAERTNLNASSVRTFLQMLVAQGHISRPETGRYRANA